MDVLKIEKFLSVGNGRDSGSGGNGNGNGNGNGRGNGYGNGYGYGYGDSNGAGKGDGNGDSNGNGNGAGKGNGRGNGGNGNGAGKGNGRGNGGGIKNINGHNVYNVDDTPTIFTHIHGNVAKGYILERNVIFKPCYIVKGSGYFAHGKTLQEAQNALEEKIIDEMDVEEKIKLFKEKFPDVNKKYAVKDFYQWHHNLTGSCEMGRKSFANSHNIDIDNDMMTVKEFIKLTENAYCGEVIKELKESYRK